MYSWSLLGYRNYQSLEGCPSSGKLTPVKHLVAQNGDQRETYSSNLSALDVYESAPSSLTDSIHLHCTRFTNRARSCNQRLPLEFLCHQYHSSQVPPLSTIPELQMEPGTAINDSWLNSCISTTFFLKRAGLRYVQVMAQRIWPAKS